MNNKQVYLLYNSASEKDLKMAHYLGTFLTHHPALTLKDSLAGQDAEDIKRIVAESDLIVPVLSIDFLSSESAIQLIEDAEKEDKKIYPILSRQCPWDMNPVLKSLEPYILPKEKPLYEYDEKTSDTAFNDIFKSLVERLFGRPLTQKSLRNNFYLYLFISACIFSAVFLPFAFAKFYNAQEFPQGDNIFYLLVIGTLFVIGIPLMQMIKPKIFKTLTNN